MPSILSQHRPARDRHPAYGVKENYRTFDDLDDPRAGLFEDRPARRSPRRVIGETDLTDLLREYGL